MKVKELIKELQELPENLEIYTASDPEGNSYNKLYYSPDIRYIDKTDAKRDRTDSAWSKENIEEMAEENDVTVKEILKDYAKVVVL